MSPQITPISKFMLDSLEVDVDGISNGKEVVIGAIVEHIDSSWSSLRVTQ